MCSAGHNGDQAETEILWVKISSEAVRQDLLLRSGNLNIVAGAGDVADDGRVGIGSSLQWLQAGKLSSNEGYGDGSLLVVCELEQGLGWAAIDQLDAKDLNLGEIDENRDIEVRELGWFLFGCLRCVLLAIAFGHIQGHN